MASVLDYIECANCKHEASDDFYYKTGEEYINCGSCGYHRSATIVNREKRLDVLTENDWKIVELKNPYGAYRIKSYQSVATQCGSLETESELAELLQHLSNNETVEFCSVSRLIDGKIVEELVIDNGPEVDGAGFTIEDR